VSGNLSSPLEQAFRRPQNRERVIKVGWPTVKVRYITCGDYVLSLSLKY